MFYLALFLLLSLIWLWPAPLSLTSRIAGDPGDPVLVTWALWWNTQALPLTERWWNAPIFYPMPGSFALSEHLLGIAVFTTPLQLAGLNPIGAYNIALILSSWLSGFFAFLLVRRLGGSATAGLVAGVAFAFSPYRAGQLSHLQVLTVQWMPAALLGMHGYLSDRRRRWLVVLAIAWLLQALSNLYFMLFFPVLIVIWMAWFVRWRSDPRAGLVLAATFIVSSLPLLPILLKYRDVHANLGLTRQLGEMQHFSADPGSLMRMTGLLKFWPHVEAKTGEDALFPGITAVLLVLVAAAVALKWTRLREAVTARSAFLFYMLATPLFWLLALGPAVEGTRFAFLKPYTWLAILPGFNGLRAPARFAMLATVTLSVAAGLAFQRLRPSRRLWHSLMTAAVFTGFFVDGWLGTIPSARPIPRLQLPEVKDAIVLELPVDEPLIGTASMFRMMDHRRPLVNGYSGHTPPHLRIVASGLQRADPTAILHFSESQPVFVVVNNQFDTNRWYEQFVGSLPGSRPIEVSAVGPVFLLPARPRPATAPPGALLQPVSVTYEDREHVTLDLGARLRVRTLSFPVRSNFDRVHPRMEVETSDDGATWTTRWLDWTTGAAIAGALENPREIPLRIHLPDVETRYLRIHPAPAWMIRNLSIFAAK